MSNPTIPSEGWPPNRGYEIHDDGGLGRSIRRAGEDGRRVLFARFEDADPSPKYSQRRAKRWLEDQRQRAWMREPVLSVPMPAQPIEAFESPLSVPEGGWTKIPTTEVQPCVPEMERQEAVITALSNELALVHRRVNIDTTWVIRNTAWDAHTWRRPGERISYTPELIGAGLYSEEEAQALASEIPVLRPIALRLALKGLGPGTLGGALGLHVTIHEEVDHE